MYNCTHTDTILRFTLSSSVTLVDRVLEDTVQAFFSECVATVTPLLQVLRELILNAIEHGNNSQSEKQIRCIVEQLTAARYRITVEDEGSALTMESFGLDQQMKGASPRKKGMTIVNNFCDSLTVDSITGAVIVTITIRPQLTWDIAKEEHRWILTPSRDITASHCEVFREHLRQWLTSSTISHGVLDLSNVETVDSVTLSELISFSKELEQHPEKELVLTGVNETLLMVFTVTQLRRLFKVEGAHHG